MMPQKEVSEAIHQQADPDYGRYEGKQTASARQHSETSNEQDVREGPSGKVYPLPRDNTKILSFALVVIALGCFCCSVFSSLLLSAGRQGGLVSLLRV
jgi:hypothetical protein